ncbi:hypothetical protein ACTXOX_26175 [Pseudomonas helleri]|uniref:hypothetical protein n=1 Tax=Pseudomonas helleri TaxID=1608996 RepID=UPI003FD4624A
MSRFSLSNVAFAATNSKLDKDSQDDKERYTTRHRDKKGDMACRLIVVMHKELAMSPEILEWINRRAPEFENLDESERNAIADFSMVWSLFEGTALGGFCNIPEIRKLAEKLAAQNKIEHCNMNAYLPYLKQRYFVNGELTHHFEHLHIERSGNPAEIVEALCNEGASEKTKLIGCLGIIFRLRNNLFHGDKWQYQLRDQKPNFINATKFLMSCM